MKQRTFVAVLFTCSLLRPQEAVVPMNTPDIVTTEIPQGSTRATLPFRVSGCSGIRLEVIVPVNGAAFAVVDSQGQAVLPAGAPEVEFMSGSALRPETSLPGGVFSTRNEIENPRPGTWNAVITYPAATQRTVAMLTMLCRSDFSVGIALERTDVVRGEQFTLGVIVVKGGAPVTGMSPSISIGPRNSVGVVTVVGRDHGLDVDGQADDGIYSVVHTFTQAGAYDVSSEVEIATPEGMVVKRAAAIVQVAEPTLEMGEVTAAPRRGPGGCVTGIDINIATNVIHSGEFRASATLEASNGARVQESVLGTYDTGPRTMTVAFPVELLRAMGTSGPHRISLVDAHAIIDGDVRLAYRRADAGTTDNVDLARLCAAPVEILDGVGTTANLAGGFIGSLALGFSMLVQEAGNYRISFKTIGSQAEDVGVFSEPRSLGGGTPQQVSMTLPSSVFLAADGPYQVISMLVRGPAGAAQASQVGETTGMSRWQFKPRINGDLDNDQDVDGDDRSILAGFVGQAAQTPGDRRDLNRDGRIDSADLDALQRLVCAAGACPLVQ